MRIDRPEFYFVASLERMRQAKLLYDEGASYAFSMYAAGVAVECMLCAFKMLRDPTFDEKHNLLKLFEASGILDFDPELLARKGLTGEKVEDHFRRMQAAVTRTHVLWSNDSRFASEVRLRADLKKRKLDREVQGDFLKANARTLLNSAQLFIQKGGLQWSLLKRSGRS